MAGSKRRSSAQDLANSLAFGQTPAREPASHAAPSAVVSRIVGRSTGGIGRHVGALATGLRTAGHDVAVVTDASTAQRFGWSDAHLLWPVHPGWSAARGLVDWHRIMLLARSADVVHAHGHQAAFVAAVAVARARPRPRLVVSLHNDLPTRAWPLDGGEGANRGLSTVGRRRFLASRY